MSGEPDEDGDWLNASAFGAAWPAWVKHEPSPDGRKIASDTPIEARLRGGGFVKNQAGNLDNWRWRESGPGSVQAYRVLGFAEADQLATAAAAIALKGQK